MMWGKKRIAGTVYDLTHLDPFEMEVPHPNGNVSVIQVQFGAHTFTEQFNQFHTKDLAICDGNGPLRAFCLHRYGHSLSLPAAVLHAVSGDACNDQGRMLINASLPGLSGPYLIAFKVRPRKTKKFDGVMTVVSAHHRPNLDLTLPTAPFQVVIAASLAGRSIGWKKK